MSNPYQPPGSNVEDPRLPVATSMADSDFIDPSELTKWTKRLLYVYFATIVVGLVSGFLEYQLLQDFQDGVYGSREEATADGAANDLRQQIVGVVRLIVFLATGVMILKWIHRASFNARQLGAEGMKFTPGWSVGWYFVPVANLWKPYQAMKEIWKASADPRGWNEGQAVPGLLGWWWFFWIVSNLFSNASFRMSMRADELEEFIESNGVALAADLLELPLTLLVLAIIARVYRMQMEHYRGASAAEK